MNKQKLRSKLYIIPIVLIFIVIIMIYHKHYEETVNIIKSEHNAKLNLIEQSIYNETKYTEVISKMIDENIVEDMEKNSKLLVEEYIKDKNILEWNLKGMQSQFDNMDIYIIDERLKVVNSSIKEEIGLDLKFQGNFSQLLKERLNGDKFDSDTMNFSIKESELRKYSYMPTPDNKYLIELSVNIKDSYPEIQDLNIVYLSKSLREKYPFIENIRVYKHNQKEDLSHDLDTVERYYKGNIYIENFSKDKQDKLVKRALESNQIQKQIIEDDDGNSRTLKYIPYIVYYDRGVSTRWESYVIEVLYDNEIVLDEISYQKRIFLKSMFTISILYFGLTYMIIYLIGKNRDIANKDYLTKLPNRKKFEEVLEDKLLEANRKKSKVVILFLDLNKFKEINDKFGHGFGDEVLIKVGDRIRNTIPKKDIVSRIGGDEFVSLVSGIGSKEEIMKIASVVSDAFEAPFNINSIEVDIKPSIGISIYPDHGDQIAELILKADDAMYESKEKHIKYKIYKNENI